MEDVRNTGRSSEKAGSDLEVPAKAKRRRFTAECKLRVLEEADACREPGEGAAWWRREGLYSSHLAAWRRARRVGSMEHSGSGAQGLYRFDANETGYTISTDEGDNRVTVKAGPIPCRGISLRSMPTHTETRGRAAASAPATAMKKAPSSFPETVTPSSPTA